ncbi:DUF3231 family protein [Bacillus pinisoli]|uniref:DUF3231 family protein n=1 Tax=Bacillus pinisoli TaxID=2901866 RepID=UPI001FF5695E|nr:DUF3231 family protein [Bacillus pinisoli]
MVTHNSQLVSTEISLLWTTYVQDSLATYIIKHFQLTSEDPDLDSILSYSLKCSNEHLEQIKSVFDQEKIPIPKAFSSQDLCEDVPKLFPDTFMYRFLEHMSRVGLSNYGLGKSTVVRKDIRKLAGIWLNESGHLYDMIIDVMTEKGILVRSPSMAYPTENEFVQKSHFFTDGFLDEDRPLLSVEISHLSTNIEANHTVSSLFLAYAQVAREQKLRSLFLRGHEIAEKHAEILSSILKKEDVRAPSGWDSSLTDSTTPPFSDYLMANNIAAIISIGISYYGTAMGASLRKDLLIHYGRLFAELGQFAEDLAELMIKHQWMEKPPQVLNREQIVKKAPRKTD